MRKMPPRKLISTTVPGNPNKRHSLFYWIHQIRIHTQTLYEPRAAHAIWISIQNATKNMLTNAQYACVCVCMRTIVSIWKVENKTSILGVLWRRKMYTHTSVSGTTYEIGFITKIVVILFVRWVFVLVAKHFHFDSQIKGSIQGEGRRELYRLHCSTTRADLNELSCDCLWKRWLNSVLSTVSSFVTY